MKIWKDGNMEMGKIWKYEPRKHENMKIWKSDNIGYGKIIMRLNNEWMRNDEQWMMNDEMMKWWMMNDMW